jgi:hypothetical protein
MEFYITGPGELRKVSWKEALYCSLMDTLHFGLKFVIICIVLWVCWSRLEWGLMYFFSHLDNSCQKQILNFSFATSI